MYGCWTIKKPERRRMDAFELWSWRRLLRLPWTARRSNQSILKEISPGCSLEGLTLKLKLQYFGHLMRRADSFEKTWCRERLKVGGEGDDRWWDGWMASLIQWTWVWASSWSWWWTGTPGMLQSMGSQRVGHDWATELNWYIYLCLAVVGLLLLLLSLVAVRGSGWGFSHFLLTATKDSPNWSQLEKASAVTKIQWNQNYAYVFKVSLSSRDSHWTI